MLCTSMRLQCHFQENLPVHQFLLTSLINRSCVRKYLLHSSFRVISGVHNWKISNKKCSGSNVASTRSYFNDVLGEHGGNFRGAYNKSHRGEMCLNSSRILGKPFRLNHRQNAGDEFIDSWIFMPSTHIWYIRA